LEKDRGENLRRREHLEGETGSSRKYSKQEREISKKEGKGQDNRSRKSNFRTYVGADVETCWPRVGSGEEEGLGFYGLGGKLEGNTCLMKEGANGGAPQNLKNVFLKKSGLSDIFQ